MELAVEEAKVSLRILVRLVKFTLWIRFTVDVKFGFCTVPHCQLSIIHPVYIIAFDAAPRLRKRLQLTIRRIIDRLTHIIVSSNTEGVPEVLRVDEVCVEMGVP